MSHITSPAGAATLIALASTNSVLSNIERTNILPICGFLYGGSSSTNEDGIPFNIVFDNIFDIIKANIIPNTITAITVSVASIDENPPYAPAINIVAIDIKNGNLPVTWYKIVC